jgi:hypothetical protein
MLQPGLAQVTRDDGQSMVLPMDEGSAQAQGLQPELAPQAPNPYSMIGSGQAVAGPGGGGLASMPTDTVEGAGVFAQPAPPPDPRVVAQQLLTPVPVSHEERPASKFDIPIPGDPGAPPKTENGGLVPVGRAARGAPAQPQGASAEIDPMIAAVMQQGGGGGGRPKLGLASETRKYHEAGPVDPALSAAIGKGQEEIDQSQSNQLEDEAAHRLGFLDQQAALQQEEAQRVQAAMQRRQAVDNEIARLNTRSQQAQDDLMNAKPKTVDQFWKDKGAAAQIGAAIAMSLGAWGATIGRTENMGLAVLDRTIERWMNDQIQQYNAAKDQATLSNNAYKDAIDTYGSPELAQTNLQLQALAAKESLIKTHAEQVGTQDALGAAALALQDSKLQRLKLQAQAQAQAGADVEAKLVMQGGGGGGNDLLSRLKRGAAAKQALDTIQGKDSNPNAVKDARERQIRLGNGEVVWTNSAPKATELQKSLTAGENAVSLMEQILQKVGTGGVVDLNTRKEIDSLQDRALTAISAQEFQGVVTKADAERAQQTLADKNAIFSDGGAGLRATLGAVKGNIQQVVRDNTYADPDATKPYAAPKSSSFKAGL